MARLNGMTLTIDKAGRLVLPKPVRDRFGLHEGSRLELSETADGIVLRQADEEPSMVKRNGRWVFRGELPAGYEFVQPVREVYEERGRRVSAL